ncbi:NFACT family protein [bacterium]|nr:NFACT family protein [bacterium]
MFTLDYITLKSFYLENKEFFEGARLQKIQQPTRRDFVFSIRGKQETRKLYINLDAQIYHTCFITDETYEKRGITIPQKPPMFCMLLRKYLEGARIVKVDLPEYERILELYFETYNELNEKIMLCLAVELMGKYSNIILYNANTKTIIGCAHNVGSEKSRERELAGNLPYIYPSKQSKADILTYNGKLDYDSLNESFLGISQSFQELFKKDDTSLEQIKEYVRQENVDYTPAIDGEKFSIYSELLEEPEFCESVSSMLDNYFSSWQEKILIRAFRLKLTNIVYPKQKKLKTSLAKLKHQLEKKESATKFKSYADLIMANLYNNSDYEKEIKVMDWETQKEIKIPLDKKLTLKENAQNYYKKFSNSKNDKEKLVNLIEENSLYLEYLDQLLYTIKEANELSVLKEILEECEENNLVQGKKQQEKKKDIDVEMREINGFFVYVGKNNKQNHKIVSKLSQPDDLWFHVQNNTGSHILLKIPKDREPDNETIYECCKLAKKYSSASDSGKAGVIYTKCKYLKRPPKANLGYVTYKNEVEIIVE